MGQGLSQVTEETVILKKHNSSNITLEFIILVFLLFQTSNWFVNHKLFFLQVWLQLSKHSSDQLSEYGSLKTF